jgi:VanZ family protein
MTQRVSRALIGLQLLPLPVARIVLAALALLTEGLQFFAIDRHPRWLDVGIDMAGALAGVGLIKLGVLCFARR